MEMNNLYNCTAYASIACADTNEKDRNGHSARGTGYYEQKAYNPKISVVCEYNEFILRIVEAYNTKYEILCEGTLFNRYSSLKIAENFFIDFTGLTKNKYNKIKKAVA